MVIDTSALIALLLSEPEADSIRRAMRQEIGNLYISSASVLEAYVVIFSKKGRNGVEALKLLLDSAGIAVQGFHEHLIPLARDAYIRYGRTSNHPAKLNFGDCFSYALTKHRINERLLCKGDDFAQTDLKLVKY